MLPASSTLTMPAPASEDHSSLDLTSTTSQLMLLTFIQPNKPMACINNEFSYVNLYAQTLPYGNDTPMDDALSS
jgi:hypothetical protein